MSEGFVFNKEKEIAIPSIESTEDVYSDLYTEGVEDAITGKQVKQVLVASADEFEYPSYLIDMTNVGVITEGALNAIYGLLSGGNTAAAVYIKNKDKILKIGYGDDGIFYTVLNSVLKQMFNGKCIIYKNKGNGFKRIRENEVDAVRLNL